jgi:hypothetical protein
VPTDDGTYEIVAITTKLETSLIVAILDRAILLRAHVASTTTGEDQVDGIVNVNGVYGVETSNS